MIMLKRVSKLNLSRQLAVFSLPVVALAIIFVLLGQQRVNADTYSWLSGDLSGQQRDDLSANPDDYGTYGKCINEMVQLAGAASPTSRCIFQAKSFRYSIISGMLYVSMGNGNTMYPVTNIGFANNSFVVPSPATNNFVFGSIVVRDLPSKITFNNQNAGAYDPNEDFLNTISLDEQNNSYTLSNVNSVSRNGQWEVINVQNIGLVRVNLTDLTMTRVASYQNLNKFTTISNNGRFVAVTSLFGYQAPVVYDLDGCGQNATTLQSSWSGTTSTDLCSSRDLTGVISSVFDGSWFTANFKPEFNEDGWQLTMFVSPGGIGGKGATLNAAGYIPSEVDPDSDGLNAAAEAAQGTSTTSKDTDGDGLDDYIESQWYPYRQAVFCGTSCAYPNPISKDVYIETDWMKEPGIFGRSFKPSVTQLNTVRTAYLAQGITAHFDTGEFGGGNELSSYTQDLYFAPDANQFDFYDYKNGTSATVANFNVNRHRIWHYMISGYAYHDVTGSSGVSYPGDDDLFISTGLITDDPSSFSYTLLDTALSGTIIHEIGHNLCLYNGTYAGQAADCQYSGIDAHAGGLYDSAMNYDIQMFHVDYSHGTNGISDDHDDWAAVLDGIDDFVNPARDAGDVAPGISSKSKVRKQLVRGITQSEARELNRQGKLGGKYKKS